MKKVTVSFSLRQDQADFLARLSEVTKLSKSAIAQDMIDLLKPQLQDMMNKAKRRTPLSLVRKDDEQTH